MFTWRIPKMWKDEQCFIIGGGPSIPLQFGVPQELIQAVYMNQKTPDVYSPYLKAIHNEHTIAVNMAFKIGPWMDVLFFGDSGFWKKYRDDILDFKGLRITCVEGVEHYVGSKVKYVGRNGRKKYGISTDPNFICWNQNSGAAAINVAVHLGVKRIILLGFDMNLGADKDQHWHKLYDPINRKTLAGTMKMHLKGFPAIAEDAKKLGVEILNANPESAITSFRKVNLKDIKI